MSRALVLLTAVLLSACATRNVDPDYRLDGDKAEGVVVVSLTYEGLDRRDSPSWSYRRLDAEGGNRIFARSLRSQLDWEAPPGRLAVFALPPGSYEFYRCEFAGLAGQAQPTWSTGRDGVITANNPWFAGFNTPDYTARKAEAYSVKFEVAAGKAIYLGNLHLTWRGPPHTGTVSVLDRAERDLGLLRTKYPNLEVGNAAVR